MAIDKFKYGLIIKDINIGSPVAEHDELLDSARVETPVFWDVLNDKFDIVSGRKGSGKTAIFKLINILSSYLLANRNLVILSGVNSSGESLFNFFKDQFEKFSEDEFENFWKLYFISLIYNQFIKNISYEAKLSECSKEIEDFKRECYKAGIPDIPAVQDRKQIIAWVLSRFPKVKKMKAPITVDINKPSLFTAIPEIEFEQPDNSSGGLQEQSIYVHSIGRQLKNILEKSGFKLWIILDRLDEVFERYSPIEFNGLRGLLRAYKSFDIGEDNDLFRIKIFIRDDIKSFLTDGSIYKEYFPDKNIPPLVAATHIFAKESPILSWTEDEIEQLVLNRLTLSVQMRNYLGISDKYTKSGDKEFDDWLKKELQSKKNRLEYWNQIFPETIASSPSLKWIFSHLRDSNGVVTPRSVIDMLSGATEYQKKRLNVSFEETNVIYPVEALKEGVSVASKNKLEKDIYNEFPKEQENIKMLGKEGKYKLNKTTLDLMYGEKWESVVEVLRRIGILRHIKNSDEYMVEFLFRPALNITYKY